MDGYAAPPYFGGFTSRAGRSLELGTERGRDSVDLHVPRGTAMKEAAVVVERPHRPLAGPDHRAPAEELESPPMAAAVEEPHPPLTPIQLPGAERHAGGRTPRDPGARQSWRAHDPSSLLTPYELGQEEEGAGEAGEDEGKVLWVSFLVPRYVSFCEVYITAIKGATSPKGAWGWLLKALK
ncbi:hypothetical protein F751_3489 [Auxenochlorella protothecoides]|uniref:Uncharacterized protein n=1 Tax=Auxenochlorella protothecoides TaxID=3075 RepID=A0A087SSF5_AUXPR|nr:hypothetical protein F751_3489 [Auxenochlorella protothecoides]KFM28659.1 hypothetical protein F751_3489 [Auxenochlorella protothecoides]